MSRTLAQQTADIQKDAREQLRAMFPPGSTATTLLRHVSASGMTRWISVVHNDEDVTWLVARALGTSTDRKYGGIKRQGCGMDMGFDLIYAMSRSLYAGGFTCIGDRCPANDHSNGDRDYTPHGHPTAGGYAVRHRWL
jgi:hypothetical protein